MVAGRNKILVSEFFELADFEDHDTGEVMLHSVLLDALNVARTKLGRPVRVILGYVREDHLPVEARPAADAHLFGAAVVLATMSAAYKERLVEVLGEDARIVVTDLGEGVRVEVGGLR
jgi:hypothetical protein